MTRSRTVVLGSLVVVLAGALAAVGAMYLDPARAAVGPLPAEAMALPADTQFLMGFDVARFVASPFYERFASPQNPGRPDALREIAEKTGIDPERDLDTVVVAGDRGRKAGGLALFKGRFDRSRISQAIEREKRATWKNHDGATVYLFNEGARGAVGVAFLDDDTIVMGTQPAVEGMLTSRAQGAAPLRSNEALLGLLEKVRPGATFWMVGDQAVLAQLPRGIPAPGAPGAGSQLQLPPLKSVIVTGDLEPVVAVDVTGEATDEAAARNLADMVRGLVAFATLQAHQKPELRELASAVNVTTQANEVRVTARFPYELLDALQPKRGVAGDAGSPAPGISR